MTSIDPKSVEQSSQLFAAQKAILCERLLFLLESLHPLLRADVLYALEGEGKFFSQSPSSHSSSLPDGAWCLLALFVAQYVNPDIDSVVASSVAVAIECYVCALDLLDDVIDDDQTATVQSLGMPCTLNVSTALLMLAQQSILSLSSQGISSERILYLLNTLQESALVAIGGEHRDILDEQRPLQEFTREECMQVAAAKAGSIMQLACRLGAACAGADDTLLEQLSELGELLGISHQLDNDSHDLYSLLHTKSSAVRDTESASTSSPGSVKSDLARGKKTLPIVLAAGSNAALQEKSSLTDSEQEKYKASLDEGIITTWGICLLYRERARGRVQEIETQRRPMGPALRFLLGVE